MLSQDELNSILNIIDKQFLLFVGSTIGPSALTDAESATLRKNGIDPESLYEPGKDIASLNYQLGMLSGILSQSQMEGFTYDSLSKYIQSGNYIPLNATEKEIVRSIQNQSLADIRSYKGRIFQDINNVVNNQFNSDRANQEAFLREKITEGVQARKSRKQIARDIAKLTGDWVRDFKKSVAYISHTAFNEGRAAIIQNKAGGGEPRVYFQVQRDACPQCIKAYLNGGPGSEPIVFTLSELQANGTNIGRKQADWQPVLGAMHPHCRCLLTEFIEGQIWDGSKFVYPKTEPTVDPSKPPRPKIRVVINGREAWV